MSPTTAGNPERLFWSVAESPIGSLLCMVDDAGRVVRIEFPNGKDGRQRDWPALLDRLAAEGWNLIEDPAATADLRGELAEFFAGTRREFSLEVAPLGTEFQKEVWTALREIPYGETRTYGELSASLGRPKASRAVGAANGANPIPIVLPCHRVIGASGSLTGFGGGLETKRALLELEQGIRRLL